MNVIVLNGSPKGELSCTLQYIRYLQKKFPQHVFKVLPIAQQIQKLERDTRAFGEVMDEIRKDLVYYDISGGGLTLSGGEPTLQFEFCASVLRAARSEGIHTCLDTCGFGPAERFLELLPDGLLERVDNQNPFPL